MKFDSITPYQRDSASHQQGGSAPDRSAKGTRPFSKDVLEALEKGDLEEAMAKLQQQAAAEDATGLLYPFFLKLKRTFKFMLLPFQTNGKNSSKRSVKKEQISQQHKAKEQGKSVPGRGVHLTKQFQTLAVKFASALFHPIKTGFEKVSSAVHQVVTQTSKVVSGIVDQAAAYTKEGLSQAVKPFSDLLERTLEQLHQIGAKLKVFGKKQGSRLSRVTEKLVKVVAKNTQPAVAWAEHHLNQAQKKIQQSFEAAMQKGTQVVERSMQVMTVAVAPFVAGFQFSYRTGHQFAGYSAKHLKRMWKTAEKWLGEKGSSAYRQLKVLLTPPLRFVVDLSYRGLSTLTNWITRLLAAIWIGLCKMCGQLPHFARFLWKKLMDAAQAFILLTRLIRRECSQKVASFFNE